MVLVTSGKEKYWSGLRKTHPHMRKGTNPVWEASIRQQGDK